MPKVAIVDQEPIVAHALGALLLSTGIEVGVITVGDAGAAADQALAMRADTVLLRCESDTTADPAIELVRRLAGLTDVVVLTSNTGLLSVAAAVTAGAGAVVARQDDPNDLFAAIRHGDTMSPAARQRYHMQVQEHRSGPEPSALDSLSRREAEILVHLMAGRSTTEIAVGDGVSVETVRSQIKAILRKLDAPSQVAAVALAYRVGWTNTVAA